MFRIYVPLKTPFIFDLNGPKLTLPFNLGLDKPWGKPLEVCEGKNKNRRILDQPPEVVSRWMRLKMFRKGPELARRLMRLWLPFKERKRKRALECAFTAIRNQSIKAERHGYTASLAIQNIALYLLIAERDIQAVKLDALTHPDWWTRNLCARLILLTLHEWDLDKVTGSRLRTALMEIKASEAVKKEAYDSLRSIRKIQQKARKELGFLRNSTIAHRDSDALAQYRAIRDLDTKHIFGLASEFYTEAERFISWMPKLIIEANTMGGLLRQLVANREINNEGQ